MSKSQNMAILFWSFDVFESSHYLLALTWTHESNIIYLHIVTNWIKYITYTTEDKGNKTSQKTKALTTWTPTKN